MFADFVGDVMQTGGKAEYVPAWSEWRVSNPRPPAPKTGALPTELHPDRNRDEGKSTPLANLYA